jgi:hypothetical protein
VLSIGVLPAGSSPLKEATRLWKSLNHALNINMNSYFVQL